MRCDALICNAGAMHPERRVTRDGWEANIACHALGHNLSRPAAAAYRLVDELSVLIVGHHLLALLLLPLLRRSRGRVVSVAATDP